MYSEFGMVVLVDDMGAPFTHADTEDVKGKSDGEAGTREIKGVAIGLYDYVDRNGRPILKKLGGKSLMKNLGNKFGESLEAVGGDARKVLTYLKERIWMMDYRYLHKNVFNFSGTFQNGCFLI